MTVLVTGAAGFLGMHVALRLLKRGEHVIGVDNLDEYYSLELKEARLAELEEHRNFQFHYLDIGDPKATAAVFAIHPEIEWVMHLAAQVGVGHSLANPQAFLSTNIAGMFILLEECRKLKRLKHVVYGSSSAVYGGNRKVPFAETDLADQPRSVYAASKRADELLAAAYAHISQVPMTGLRLFAIYGPRGRPDMFYYAFTKAIQDGRPIKVYNNGDFKRDFTYVDDAVEGVLRTLDKVATPDPNWRPEAPDSATSSAPYRVYNIGNNSPVALIDYIAAIEKALGRTAKIELLPQQPGDVEATYAGVEALKEATGFQPSTPLEEGIERFVAWYRDYYRV